MEENTAETLIRKVLGYPGKLLDQDKSSYKAKHPSHQVYHNANIFVVKKTGLFGKKEVEKVWYGDIDVTLYEKDLKEIADKTKTDIYILREMDGRFENEDRTDVDKVAVWKS